MKERVKSIILVILVIFTLVLAERILVDKKLWPEGYNFFNIGKKQTDSGISVSDNLILPDRIIINTGDQTSRFEYLRTSGNFKKIHNTANDVLKIAFSAPAKNISRVPAASWYSALTGKSAYLSYPGSFSAQNFAGLMGINRTEASFSNFCHIVISESGSVFIDDNGTFYKIETSSDAMASIIDSVAKKNQNSESVINYSFDLNFDKEFGSQKTILSPMIPIYSEAVKTDVIVAENPLLTDGEIDQETVDALLTAFSVNPNSIWRYTEADGTVVFVENTGVLKISPDGILTWTATEAGISLSGQFSATPYENASAVASFIDNVNSVTGQDAQMSLTSPLTGNNTEKFTFDYNINGIPVKFNSRSAVSVTVKDGYIVEYSQVLRRYSSTGDKASSPFFFEALDEVIAKHQNMNHINIEKMYPAYIDDLTLGEKQPDWYIEIDTAN